MADLTVLRARLEEGELAAHRLATGKGVQELQQANGDRVRYTPGDLSKLQRYLSELRAEIDALVLGDVRVRRQPILARF